MSNPVVLITGALTGIGPRHRLSPSRHEGARARRFPGVARRTRAWLWSAELRTLGAGKRREFIRARCAPRERRARTWSTGRVGPVSAASDVAVNNAGTEGNARPCH